MQKIACHIRTLCLLFIAISAAHAHAADEPAHPPPGWTGTGVLAKASTPSPKGAPPWVGIAAEVVSRDGTRYLQTTGTVDKIADVALARSSAENRARAEMARWLQTDVVKGASVTNTWLRKRHRAVWVQVEVALTNELLPSAS